MVLGKNLGQIIETGNVIRFFSYYTWSYPLKQEAVVVKPPEWNFKDVRANFSPDLGPKWQKKLIILNSFTLVSQS